MRGEVDHGEFHMTLLNKQLKQQFTHRGNQLDIQGEKR